MYVCMYTISSRYGTPRFASNECPMIGQWKGGVHVPEKCILKHNDTRIATVQTTNGWRQTHYWIIIEKFVGDEYYNRGSRNRRSSRSSRGVIFFYNYCTYRATSIAVAACATPPVSPQRQQSVAASTTLEKLKAPAVKLPNFALGLVRKPLHTFFLVVLM